MKIFIIFFIKLFFRCKKQFSTKNYRSTFQKGGGDRLHWNMLPCEVKNASSLNCFKYELETYKKKCSEYGESSKGHFWELSCEVLNRIERNGYVENKNLHNEYLKKNPFVAKAKFINLN